MSKLTKAQDEIDGLLVAQMILDFHTEFRDVYPPRHARKQPMRSRAIAGDGRPRHQERPPPHRPHP
jgi:hypothetical protein